MNIRTLIIIQIVTCLVFLTFSFSLSSFSSSAKLGSNTISVASIATSPSPSARSTSLDHLVISEVAYKGDYPLEWVELYNPTPNTVSLSGWVIEDNISSETLPSIDLAPGTYYLLLPEDSTGTKIGSGLADTGDRVILKNNTSIIIDGIRWGTDPTISLPLVPSVVTGHSVQRNPLTVDTDTSADFIDQSVPTKGF